MTKQQKRGNESQEYLLLIVLVTATVGSLTKSSATYVMIVICSLSTCAMSTGGTVGASGQPQRAIAGRYWHHKMVADVEARRFALGAQT